MYSINYMNEHGTSVRETAAIFNLPSETHSIFSFQKLLEARGRFSCLFSVFWKSENRPPASFFSTLFHFFGEFYSFSSLKSAFCRVKNANSSTKTTFSELVRSF